MKEKQKRVLAGEMTLLGMSMAPMEAAIAGIKQMLDDCMVEYLDRQKSGQYDDKLASHYAWLTDKLTSKMSEARKLEAQHRRYGEQMTPAQLDARVIDYIRGLPPERLSLVVQAMADVEREEGPGLLG